MIEPQLVNPEAPNPQLAVVQKLRLRYAKRGRMRFISHRDFVRAFERAVRRAAVPVAFSSGYHPRPRISYAGAAPTGASSDAEFLELSLTRRVDPDQVRIALDATLPDGLSILDAQTARSGALGDTLEASHWIIDLGEIGSENVVAAIEIFLAADQVEVQRMTKRGLRTFDCRAAVVGLAVREEARFDPGCAILDVVVRHGTPSVRPDDVLAGLRDIGGLAHEGPLKAHRRAQGPLDPPSGTVGDPFALDRDASPG